MTSLVAPSIPKALALLTSMEKELTSANTYEKINEVIKKARALKELFKKVEQVEHRAQLTIVLGKRRIGEELKKVPKATGKNVPSVEHSKEGTGIKRTERHRLGQLANVPEDVIRETSAKLHENGKDATVNALLKEISHDGKKQRRTDKMQSLADKAMVMPTEHYVVAVMDPAWREEPWSRETGLNKAADNHYPTQTPAEIAANKPPLTKDGIVYMWTTTSMMRVAIGILEDWGLEYRSHMMWVKERKGKAMGTGRWSRVDHEIVLIYTQGKPPAPAESDRISSVLYAPVRKHSEKPDEFYDMILRNYPPPVPLLEMYGRKQREGFTVLGNEALS